MGVATDYDGDACGLRVNVEVVDGVQHVDKVLFKFDCFCRGECGARAVRVHVAANCCDGSNLRERCQDVWIANISGVQNVLGFGEGNVRFGAKQTMRIGDHTYQHRYLTCYRPLRSLVRGSMKSRSASPIKLNESTQSITAMAGKQTMCGESKR